MHCLKFKLINETLDVHIAPFGQAGKIVYMCVTCPFGSFAEDLLDFFHGPTWHRPCQSLCRGHPGYFFDHKLTGEPTGTKNDNVIPLGSHHQQSPCLLNLVSFSYQYALNSCVVCTVNCPKPKFESKNTTCNPRPSEREKSTETFRNATTPRFGPETIRHKPRRIY